MTLFLIGLVVGGLVGAFLNHWLTRGDFDFLVTQHQKNIDALNASNKLTDQLASQRKQELDESEKTNALLRSIEVDLERENARLRLALQKYETGGEHLKRLGAGWDANGSESE